MRKITVKGVQSRQQILTAAIELFSEKGFAGTSVDEIVDSAGANKRMVYHYFGSKEKLFQAVLATEYSKLEALEVATFHPEEPIEKIMNDIVSSYFSFLESNPEFVQLILWENLNRGRTLDKMQIPLSKSPMLDLLIEAVTIGKERGTIRPEIDPHFLLISLIGNCMIYYSNRYTLFRAMGMNLNDREVLHRAKDAVADLLINGISKQ